MDVSIITSLYKSENFLPAYFRRIETFAKKVSRTNIDLEFILIANDINSEEEKIIVRWHIPNLKILKVNRETLYASWNRGILEASSDILVFWNVDDIRFPGALYKGIDEIGKGAQLVYFSFIMMGLSRILLFRRRISVPFYNLKRTKALPYNREDFMKGCMCGPFFMFHRTVFETIGPFDETFVVAGDFDWFARAAFMNIKFKELSVIGGVFFTHSGNLTVKYSKIQADENKTVLNRYYYLNK
jgi:glycosyltransferase involved in cell wall biosynthesis